MDNRRKATPWEVAYRSIVLAALLGGFGTVFWKQWSYQIEQHDAANLTAWTMNYQTGALVKLTDKLDRAFSEIATSNSVVVGKLGEIQHQIDVLDGRVRALEQSRK